MHPSLVRDNLYYFEIYKLRGNTELVFYARRAARRGADGARPLCHSVTSPHLMGSNPSSPRDNLHYFEIYKLRGNTELVFYSKNPETTCGFGVCFLLIYVPLIFITRLWGRSFAKMR